MKISSREISLEDQNHESFLLLMCLLIPYRNKPYNKKQLKQYKQWNIKIYFLSTQKIEIHYKQDKNEEEFMLDEIYVQNKLI